MGAGLSGQSAIHWRQETWERKVRASSAGWPERGLGPISNERPREPWKRATLVVQKGHRPIRPSNRGVWSTHTGFKGCFLEISQRCVVLDTFQSDYLFTAGSRPRD